MMATISDMILRMAEKHPAPPSKATPVIQTHYCRSCSDFVQVATPDDVCPKCAAEKMRGYQALMLSGRCANGAERDHGTRNHAVPFGEYKALCGAKPGRRSVGWNTPYQSRAITCPRCLKKLPPTEHIQNVAASLGCKAEVVPPYADPTDDLKETRADDRPAVDEAPWTVGECASLAYGDADIGTWAEKYPPVRIVYKPAAECDHAREYPIIGGIFCRGCGRTREPATDFERRLVSKLDPRWGYVIG